MNFIYFSKVPNIKLDQNEQRVQVGGSHMKSQGMNHLEEYDGKKEKLRAIK